MQIPSADYDHPWKAALYEYLPDFFSLCFPRLYARIDWSVAPIFLETELQQIVREADHGLLHADILVRLAARGTKHRWVVMHVEVQSQADSIFARRMYHYHTRIADRYDQEVISLGVLADERSAWRPAAYRHRLWGCTVWFRYPVCKVADWRRRRTVLLADRNPFATVLLPHLTVQDTRRDMEGRQAAKLALVRRLYDLGYARDRVVSLFRLIDWLLALPAEAEQVVRQAIAELEEARRMPYITSLERHAAAEGREEGRRDEARRAVLRVVARRFGSVPPELAKRLAGIHDLVRLEALHDTAITAGTVAEVADALEREGTVQTP